MQVSTKADTETRIRVVDDLAVYDTMARSTAKPHRRQRRPLQLLKEIFADWNREETEKRLKT